MSDGIKNKLGPYRHADGAALDKVFGTRRFKVVIAGALQAGIIGPERNGIVVLDENNHQVVLDEHCREDSGYSGPSQRQWAELKRIMAMDWAAFAAFCRNHPRYREGSIPDVNEAEPDTFPPLEDRTVFPADQKPGADCPYSFPLSNRLEIVNFLLKHSVHRVGGPYTKFALAWYIKVHDFDMSGKQEGFTPDPRFDERWREHVETDHHLFWDAASEAVRSFTEGDYSTWPGKDAGDYSFGVAGRSGGWLVLKSVNGLPEPCWEDIGEYEQWLYELSDEQLMRLYKLVVSVDHDVQGRDKEMAHQYACQRQVMEDMWAQEMEPSKP